MEGKQLLSILFISMVIIIGCSKNDNDDDHEYIPDDVVAPVIEVTTPADNQVFSNSNTINITGKVTDDKGLYRGSIRITNDANGSLLKEQLYEIHGVLSYTFNLPYQVAATTASDYTITVHFEDHGTNKTSKSVKVKANP